tara:strand:+ start:1312 stop:1746 length:435 start_codon:yes stop_codon:yes gene_type:complete
MANELDTMTNIVLNELNQNNNVDKNYVIRNYTGRFASGGQKSIHDIFRGGQITNYELKPLLNSDGSPALDVDGKAIYENVPVRSMMSGDAGNKGMANRGLAGGINFYKPQQASVGRFTPLQMGNRNAPFLNNMLRFNPNLKGLI